VTTVEHSPEAVPGAPESEASGVDDHHVQKLVRLGLAVAALIALSVATGTFAIAAFVMAVVVIVMLHELGHFVTAKRAGMKVTEYFLGFGPRLWSVRKGETEYGVKAIPLGGYVKIIGMSNMEKDINPADEPRTYRQGSYRSRVIVALAGIFTHFLIAFLLLMVLWTVVGVPNVDRASLRQVEPNGPADQAGFQVGDRVVSVDGRTEWGNIRTYLRDHPGQLGRQEAHRRKDQSVGGHRSLRRDAGRHVVAVGQGTGLVLCSLVTQVLRRPAARQRTQERGAGGEGHL